MTFAVSDFGTTRQITVILWLKSLADLSAACQTDSLSDAVNYVDIFEKIKDVMEKERYDLLERVAQRLADRVLEDSRVTAVVLRIRKPGVPLSGMLDGVQIEIQRGRES